MAVTFEKIKVGSLWERKALTELWGYKSFHALARGLITPSNDNKLVLFITHEKHSHSEQYKDDLLSGNDLQINGEAKHGSDERIIKAADQGDEIHLFYRELHKESFTYHGEIDLVAHKIYTNQPSTFAFKLRR